MHLISITDYKSNSLSYKLQGGVHQVLPPSTPLGSLWVSKQTWSMGGALIPIRYEQRYSSIQHNVCRTQYSSGVSIQHKRTLHSYKKEHST